MSVTFGNISTEVNSLADRMLILSIWKSMEEKCYQKKGRMKTAKRLHFSMGDNFTWKDLLLLLFLSLLKTLIVLLLQCIGARLSLYNKIKTWRVFTCVKPTTDLCHCYFTNWMIASFSRISKRKDKIHYYWVWTFLVDSLLLC